MTIRRQRFPADHLERLRWLVLIMLAGGIVACGLSTASSPSPAPSTPSISTSSVLDTSAVAQTPISPTPTSKVMSCPRLHADLLALSRASDPGAFAARHRLFYEGRRTRVGITLVAPEGDLAQRYNLQVETRSRIIPYIEALIPIDNLCPLANDPRVGYVQPPRPPKAS